MLLHSIWFWKTLTVVDYQVHSKNTIIKTCNRKFTEACNHKCPMMTVIKPCSWLQSGIFMFTTGMHTLLQLWCVVMHTNVRVSEVLKWIVQLCILWYSYVSNKCPGMLIYCFNANCYAPYFCTFIRFRDCHLQKNLLGEQ